MAFEYKPTAVGTAFHESDAGIKMIMGPFGSGKSTIAAMDLLYYAMAQPAASDNVRYSRWGVIRAGYPNLVATRRSLIEIMPQGGGCITLGGSPMRGAYQFPLPDGTRCQVEFDMWSVMTLENAFKLRSSNWTGAWINEATEVTFDVLAEVTSRIGRYPPNDKGGLFWSGVLMDFNRPPKDHWLWSIFEKDRLVIGDGVHTLAAFVQPPAAFCTADAFGKEEFAVNPEAENLENLDGGTAYYSRQIALRQAAGQTDEIKSLYCLLDTGTKRGRPVWPTFRTERHVARTKIDPMSGVPLIIGLDTSGIHPAAVLAQLQLRRWCVVDELFGDQEGLEVFMNAGLIPLVRGRYAAAPEVIAVCDPANARDSYTGLAPTAHLQRAGFVIAPRTTNRPETRIAAVAALLNLDIGGLLISPHCVNLIEAMRGGDGPKGYHYRKHRLQGSVELAYSDVPEKNQASHYADALEYLALHINQVSNDEPTYEERAVGMKIRSYNAGRRRIMMRQ